MKRALTLLLSFAAIALATDPPKTGQDAKPDQVKKLTSVTWDLNSHKLVWTVQTGSEATGQFVASSEQRYEITPDKAVMAVAQEQRGFSDEEAANLHHLLDVLSLYCAESVVWWDQGQGTPLDHNGTPRTPAGKPNSAPAVKSKEAKPVKVRDVQPPKPRIPDGSMVASVSR